MELWSKAFVPADQKIRGIEDGLDLGRTDIIQSPRMILDLFTNMIKSAKTEILLMLPTINAFLREDRIGVIELLKKSATENNVNVRIITPSNDSTVEMDESKDYFQLYYEGYLFYKQFYAQQY